MSYYDDAEGRSAQSLTDGLLQAVRENPMSAAAIGMGVVWMLFSRRVPSVNDLVQLPRGAARLATERWSSVSDSAHDLARTAASTAGDALTAVTSFVDTASVNDVKDASGKLNRKARRAAQKVQAPSRFNAIADLFHQQPLALGAVGLAIGAGLASAFPTTKIESDYLGEQGTQFKSQIRALVDEGVSQANALKDEMLHEAEAQGLTPTALTDKVKELGAAAASVLESGKASLSAPETAPAKGA